MRPFIRPLYILITIFFVHCTSNHEKVLSLKGTVLAENTKTILLLKPNQDLRFDSLIEIPVINGKFHYKSKLKHPESVTLLLGQARKKGGGRIMPLFLENDEIQLTIYPEEEFDKNIVVGGLLNKKYKSYQKESNTILETKSNEEWFQWRQEYITKNPNIISYSLFLQHLINYQNYIDLSKAKKNFVLLKKTNPEHPYNDLAQKLLTALDNVKVGKKFIDFSAPDLEGNRVKFSERIKGKIAVLDLWATWCAPCIVKSRKLLPIYEDYKNRDFMVIGVAGEFKNKDRLTKFLMKEKWPWTNLVELNRQNNIWAKYGVDGKGGQIFLIDKEGTILAKDPTPQEIRFILEKNLN